MSAAETWMSTHYLKNYTRLLSLFQWNRFFFSYSLFSRVSFEYEKVVSDQMLKGFVLRSLDYIF